MLGKIDSGLDSSLAELNNGDFGARGIVCPWYYM